MDTYLNSCKKRKGWRNDWTRNKM